VSLIIGLSNILLDDALLINNNVNLGELENKSILITGASGLLGTYFLASLRNYINRTGKYIDITTIFHSEPPSYFKEIMDCGCFKNTFSGDLIDSKIFNLIKSFKSKYDYIIHCAGYGQPRKFIKDPIKTIQLNTFTVINLLNLLKSDGKFLFLSTGEVYSGSPNAPYKETDIGLTNTDHLRSCYIEGKRCGEAICSAYRNQGINVKCARLVLAYGAGVREDDTRVMSDFIKKGLSGSIKLLDDGSDYRTYCYVTDAVEILWKILLEGKDFIYNVGGISHITIRELAQIIGDILYVPVRLPDSCTKIFGAPNQVALDITKNKK